MTPDEVRMLDNRYALLFIRGERPVMDFKFDILKHPNLSDTADGKEKPYVHGEVTKAVASIELAYGEEETAVVEAVKGNYELLSEEDVQKLYEKQEEENV